jgi:ATP:cob(I)alamin adenosyltransferase
MKRIYTRTGDNGTTGIFGGERVGKDDIRIEANGTIDELNTVIGIVRSLLSEQDEWQGWLYEIQMELMACMSHIATPSAKRNENPNVLRSDLTGIFEKRMDKMNAEMGDNGYFILPGGTRVSAQIQYARVMARRAERRLYTLHKEDPLPEGILRLLNRLSDLFFVMARYEMYRQGWTEEKWKSFGYKRKISGRKAADADNVNPEAK